MLLTSFLLLAYVNMIAAQLSWSPCSTYRFATKDTYRDREPTSTSCATVYVPYYHNFITDKYLNVSMKKYSASESLGTVILIGDTIPLNSGAGVERVATRLYNTLSGVYDIIVPEFRGSIYNCSVYYNYDAVAQDYCQKRHFDDWSNSAAFSVDQIAFDIAHIIKLIKSQNNQNVTLFGRGVGSYVLHRVLQLNNSIVDAVIMDGVCAGKYCNASDWDVQRDQMGKKILNQLFRATNSTSKHLFSTFSYEPVSTFKTLLSRVKGGFETCGRTMSRHDFRRKSTFMLFDTTLRPWFLSALFHLTRCNYWDYSIGFITYRGSMVNDYFRDITTKDISFLSSNVIISELYNGAPDEESLLFSQEMPTYMEGLKKQGWKAYNTTLRNEIAAFNKPMLFLNGEYDPMSTIQSATGFASHFNQSTLIILPGMTSDTFMKSYVRGQSQTFTCGMDIVAQFMKCPTCNLNKACIQNMEGLTFDGDDITKRVLGDPFLVRTDLPLLTIDIINLVIYSIPILVPVIIWILLFVFRKNTRVKSRAYGPIFGLAYVFSNCLCFLVIANAYTSITGILFGQIVYDVCIAIAATVVAAQTIRFYLLSTMYSVITSNSNSAKLLKFLTNKIFSLIIFIVVGVFWSIFGLIIFVISFFIDFNAIQVFGSPVIVFSVLVMIVALLFFFYDFITFCTRTNCNLSSYFTSDPLLFRLDSILILPIIVTGVTSNIIFATINTSYTDLYIASNILNAIFMLLLCLFLGGNVSIACIVDAVRGSSERWVNFEGDDVTLKFLHSEVGMAALLKYSEKEFSLENVVAYSDINKTLKSTDSNLDAAILSVQTKFMLRTSAMELNVAHDVAQSFDNLMNNLPNSTRVEKNKVLSDVQQAVLVNIKDTMDRFKFTREFEECERIMNLSEDVTKAMDFGTLKN